MTTKIFDDHVLKFHRNSRFYSHGSVENVTLLVVVSQSSRAEEVQHRLTSDSERQDDEGHVASDLARLQSEPVPDTR